MNYGFQDKYLLTATVRRDGSSKFGPDKRYGLFPSASVAWRVSQEDFLQSSQLIDDLKFRVSYGLTGNQNIGDFAFITRAGAAPYVFGNSVVVGNAPQNIGNPNLQWEATKQFDIGIDLSLFEGRIYSTLDYYDKQSEDLLISTPIPLTSGVSQDPIVNLGSVKNTGVEFSVLSRNIIGAFSWTTDFNISYNKNEVIDIGTNSIGEPLEIPGQLIPLSNQQANLTRAGHPVGAFYMYQYDGVWQQGQEDEALRWSSAVPGDPRYADLNGNGVLDVEDKTFVGNPHPKFFGGMDNTFAYKNLSLSVFLNFATGYQVYNTARNLFSRGVPFVQNFAEVNGFWTPENPSNTVPRPSQGGNTTTLTTLVSDRFLEDADFLRVKNVRLSYNFPASFFSGRIVRGAQLSLTATNLFTFTKYSGLDPEASSRTSLLSAGIDYTPYPLTRLISLGAQFTF
ncbi:SusC/RagA family TonB-linked outer membrane protein [Catalinimonas alkaloidigena]|uniref:SusC/RagA family TonB-linked outer membrane protein n=1 Tax=Catalinimonas alkaloidigena TaxID=1075417 RepID=UPI002406BBBF|nr:SusC/RagA family TonB-linked outer membrane protein [Catalinimonas alkaloidigena]